MKRGKDPSPSDVVLPPFHSAIGNTSLPTVKSSPYQSHPRARLPSYGPHSSIMNPAPDKTGSTDTAGDAPSPSGSCAEDSTKKKSTKKAVSCESCRRRKLKCDRGWPCGACRDRGESSKCEWANGVRPQTTGRDDGETSQVNTRLDRLEAMMGAIANSLGVQLPGAKDTAAKSKGKSGASSAVPSSSDVPTTASISKLNTLAELGAVEANKAAWLASRSNSTDKADGSRYPPFSTSNAWGFGFGHFLFNSVSSEELTRKALFDLISLLPDTETVRTLSGFYFSELSWLAHLIPEELFHRKLKAHEEMRLLWDGRPNSYKYEDMRDHLRFMAILHALCGASLVFGEPIEDDLLAEKYGKNVYAVFLDASQHALSVLDIYEDMHIDNVRAMMMISTCLNALKGPTVGSAMMANIYFMAYALQMDVEPSESLPYEERKDRINLFATLCISDWFSAGNVKRSYTIDPANTSLPSLFGPGADKNEMVPLPMRFKLKLSDISRRASHRMRMSEEEAYHLTKQLHHEVVTIEANMPEHLRFDESLIGVDDNPERWHRSAMALAIQMQLLTLHKRFYVQSWTDSKYKESRDISFAASMLIIKIFRNAFKWFNPRENSTLDEQRALIGEGMRKQRNSVSRLWFFAQMSIISSLVLIHFVSMLDTHPQEACDWDSSELRAQITDDLKFVRLLLQALSSKSKLALDGARAIQPPETSRKRKAEETLIGPGVGNRGPLHSRSLDSIGVRNSSWYSSSGYSSGSTPFNGTLRTPPAYNSPGSSSTSSHSMPPSASASDLVRPKLPFEGQSVPPGSAKSFDDIEALWHKQPWQTASLRMGTSPNGTGTSPVNSFPPGNNGSSASLTSDSSASSNFLLPKQKSGQPLPYNSLPPQQYQQQPFSTGMDVTEHTNMTQRSECPSIGASFFGPDASFKDIASAEAAIGRQDASYLYPVAPLSPFTAAFINSLDQYVTSLDEPMPSQTGNTPLTNPAPTENTNSSSAPPSSGNAGSTGSVSVGLPFSAVNNTLAIPPSHASLAMNLPITARQQ